jgi:hypothetical protein
VQKTDTVADFPGSKEIGSICWALREECVKSTSSSWTVLTVNCEESTSDKKSQLINVFVSVLSFLQQTWLLTLIISAAKSKNGLT